MSEVLPYSDVLLISGDLNINLLSLNQNEEYQFFRILNLTQLVNEPTRVTYTIQILIDVLITSDTECILINNL